MEPLNDAGNTSPWPPPPLHDKTGQINESIARFKRRIRFQYFLAVFELIGLAVAVFVFFYGIKHHQIIGPMIELVAVCFWINALVKLYQSHKSMQFVIVLLRFELTMTGNKPNEPAAISPAGEKLTNESGH